MEHISFKQFTAAGFLSAQERKKERRSQSKDSIKSISLKICNKKPKKNLRFKMISIKNQ
jgi:hypothetical protein